MLWTRIERAIIKMTVLYVIAIYAVIGFVIAIGFVTSGFRRALPHVASVTAGARILLVPGAAALWPYVLARWLKS